MITVDHSVVCSPANGTLDSLEPSIPRSSRRFVHGPCKPPGVHNAFRELNAKIITSLRLEMVDNLTLQRQLDEIGKMRGCQLSQAGTRRSDSPRSTSLRELPVDASDIHEDGNPRAVRPLDDHLAITHLREGAGHHFSHRTLFVWHVRAVGTEQPERAAKALVGISRDRFAAPQLHGARLNS